MDAVSLFAIIVFGAAWFFFRRTEPEAAVVRLFLGTLMFLGAAVGVLGVLSRLLT